MLKGLKRRKVMKIGMVAASNLPSSDGAMAQGKFQENNL